MEREPVVVVGNLIELARGYRRMVRGEGTWTIEELGPLKAVVRDDRNQWRPDYLYRARQALVRCFEAAADTAPEPGAESEQDKRKAASKAVRAYWGVDAYPLERTEALGVSDDASPTQSALRQRLSDREHKVCVAAIAGGFRVQGDDDDPAPPSALLKPSDRTSPSAPLWDLNEPAAWPPVQSEREWLTREVTAYLGEELIPGTGPVAQEQALQLLRRRAEELHRAYLDVTPKASEARRIGTTARVQHLTYRVASEWFADDILDLRSGLAYAPAVLRTDVARELVAIQRSQAALAALFFYSVVLQWQEAAMSRILRERMSVWGAYPRAAPALLKKEGASFKEHQPQDGPPFVQAARSREARSLFQQSLDIRQGAGVTDIDTYSRNRAKLDDVLSSLDLHSRRTILLADHGVHLYAAGKVGPSLSSVLDAQLQESSKARVEYAVFLMRDRSIEIGKSNTLSALQASLVFLDEARHELRHAVLDDGTSRREYQVELETRHQLDLATAGSTVKVLEQIMSNSRLQKPGSVNQAIVRRVRAPMQWADAALGALSELDKMGALVESRYRDGYLADASWHVQTRVIRLRCMCAEFTMQRALGLPAHDNSPTPEGIDIAYRDLVTTKQLTENNLPLVLQLTQWVAFLRGNSLPDVGASIAIALRKVEELSQFSPAGNARVAIDDVGYQKLSRRIKDASYDFGGLDRIDRASPVGTLFEAHSGGYFGRWLTWAKQHTESPQQGT
ncbi:MULTISPECIES: hypothetical protein [unclassified Microbacterium]|uniref:hypothetical protein n=1 Tax=unclassified Microbacterium TaxID=2609290 RepID=UPI0010F57F5D|nr:MULTISPECIES: hypothetical protein [unclassified Microbacterium]